MVIVSKNLPMPNMCHFSAKGDCTSERKELSIIMSSFTQYIITNFTWLRSKNRTFSLLCHYTILSHSLSGLTRFIIAILSPLGMA